jgi:curved DNA-binding protein CbpA
MTERVESDIMSHYRTLGIAPGASAREIKRAARRLFLTYHPDLNPGDRESCAAKLRVVIHAYKCLMDRDAVQSPDGAHEITGAATFEILVFEISQRLFALPLRQVREVLRAGDIRIDDIGIVSDDFPFIAGAFYRNGELVMLWNLHRHLNLSEISIASDFGKNKLIIAEYDESMVGFIAGDVRGVAEASRGAIEPACGDFYSQSVYLRGVAQTDHGPAGLLSLGNLLYNAL